MSSIPTTHHERGQQNTTSESLWGKYDNNMAKSGDTAKDILRMVRRVITYQAEKKGKSPAVTPGSNRVEGEGEDGFVTLPAKQDRMQRIMDFHGLEQLKDIVAAREAGVDDYDEAKEAKKARVAAYNKRFKRPYISKKVPLRTVLLDKQANTIPPSKTYAEMMQKRKMMNMPDLTYDVDGDGVVSQEDFMLAKHIDDKGTGVLTPIEQEVCRLLMVEEFLRDNQGEADKFFGPQAHHMSLKESISAMAESKMFSKNMKRMKNMKKTHRSAGSVQMKLSLTEPPPPTGITRTALFESRRAEAHHMASARLHQAAEQKMHQMFLPSARG